jgi:hypothetical protein
MIVAVSYHFHDYEVKLLLLDTARLDANNPFERDVKAALERDDPYATLDGNAYADDFGDVGRAEVRPPALVDAGRCLFVQFE